MSVKGKSNELAGFIEEETGELLNDKDMADKGRDLRNKGRMQEGKLPKLTPPGSGN